MASVSDYLETKLLNYLLAGEAYSPPATLYAALFTNVVANDAELEGGDLTNEVSGNGYQRTPIYFASTIGGTSINSLEVQFQQATGDWGTIKHIAIMNVFPAGTGEILLHTQLAPEKTVVNGDSVRFAPNNITVSIT